MLNFACFNNYICSGSSSEDHSEDKQEAVADKTRQKVRKLILVECFSCARNSEGLSNLPR